MPDRSPTVEALLRQAEAAAAETADPIAIVVLVINMAIQLEADPYLLAGTLTEGIATVVAQRVPQEQQGTVATEAVRLLRDRFGAYGII